MSQVHNWPQRASSELTHHNESRASLQRGVLESTCLKNGITLHSEFRARSSRRDQVQGSRSSPQRAIYSLQRAKAVSDSLMTWQKPIDEATSTRHSEL
ncbi:hypothetical protein QL285_010956 [Trifolium repens]|nr:hypothetical protein QL285_010956 [Trifolium repens]